MSSRINHVSVNATDLDESVAFYIELLGAQPIATPNFGFPVQWLALGRTQLHIFIREGAQSAAYHHIGVTVDDLEPVYRAAERRDAFEPRMLGSRLIELPGGVIQLFVRDPAGNLIEIDHESVEGADGLPDDMRAQLRRLADDHPQTDEQASGRLFIRN